MMEWIWVRRDVVLAVHDRQIAEHGGPVGIRDENALESALARPQNLAAYEEPDAAALAAAYAFGIARNHPFADGNKQTSWMLARLFLSSNGFRLAFDKPDATRTVFALAAGNLTEDQLASWFRERVTSAE